MSKVCSILVLWFMLFNLQEQRLRLLNFQNNNIRLIQNLENLPNLIFLDLYNNKITTLEGSVSSVKGI